MDYDPVNVKTQGGLVVGEVVKFSEFSHSFINGQKRFTDVKASKVETGIILKILRTDYCDVLWSNNVVFGYYDHEIVYIKPIDEIIDAINSLEEYYERIRNE